MSSVAITSGTGIQNSRLNAGDVVNVTVTLNEATTVTGSPQLALNIGGTTVQASYASGSGTTALVFQYTITNQTDTDGISIGANGLTLNSGTLKDAAGNSAVLTHGAVADNAGYLVDTTAPAYVSAAAHSADKTIALTYNSALDGSNLPATSAFAVTTGGASNPVASISVSGSTMTLTLTNAFSNGASVNVVYTDPAGDATLAIQDLAGNDAPDLSISSGLTADGYIRGAQIWIDTDNDGHENFNTGLVTDENGNFWLPAGTPSGGIIAIGGVNIDTGVPNTQILKAPAGATTVNPLTTLVQTLVEQGTDAATASSQVVDALGLSVNPADLSSYDPISANDVNTQQAAAQVATMVALAGTGGGAVINALVTQIETAVAEGGAVNLTDAGTLGAILDAAGVVDTTLQSTIADATAAIGSATDIGQISTAQSQYLDTIAPDAPTLDLLADSDSGSSSADNVTNDTTPTIQVLVNNTATDGKAAVVNDVVVVYSDGVQVGSVVLTAGHIANGYVDVTLSTQTEGAHSYSATLTDQAGNTNTFASNQLAVTLDTLAPSAPTINAIAGDDIVNGSEQTAAISGSAAASASVAIAVGGNTRTVTADGSGSWTYALTAADITAMGQGAETISVAVTDAAGNTSALSTRSITVDTVAPTATVTITGASDNVDPTQGNVASGGTSNDNTLGLSGSISGSLGGGENLAIYDGSTRLGLASVSGSTWSFTTASLSNAVHSFTARVEDAAGNQGAASSAYELTVDATVPSATVSIDTANDDADRITGPVSSGGTTNDSTPVLAGTITGTLNSGDQVVIYDNGARLGAASISGSGWTYAPTALSAGTHSFTAVVEASGGNQGAMSSAYGLTVDTAGPGTPGIALAADTGSSSTDGITSNGTINVAGLESGATWEYSIDGGANWVTGSGTSFALTESDYGGGTIQVRQIDAAGNVGSAGIMARALTVDTTAAADPVFNLIATDDRINASEKSAGVAINGTADIGARVDLTIAGVVRTVSADGSGNWTYALTSADYTAMGQGAETITAKATDLAGNVSRTVSYSIIGIDTVAPTLTPFTLASVSDSGTQGDNRSNATTPDILFTAENGVALALSIDGGATYTDAGLGTGLAQTLSVTGLTTDGAYAIYLKATDGVGNTTVRNLAYTLDTTAPTAPAIDVLASSDTGANSSDNISADTTPTVRVSFNTTATDGTAAAVGGVVKLYAGATLVGSATLTAINVTNAYVDITANALTGDAIYDLTAHITDVAGNTSAVSGTISYQLDTAVPAAASIAGIDVNSGSTTDRLTSDNTPTLTVSAEAGAILKVGQNGVETTVPYTVQETSAGNYTITFSSALADGTYGVRVIDKAGNASALLDGPQPYKFTIDTVAPTVVASLTADSGASAADGNTNLAGLTVSVAEIGVTRTYTVDGGTASASYDPTALADGQHTVTVTDTDAAGNSGSASFSFTLDTTAPVQPQITAIADNSGSTADRVTNDNTLTLTVSAEPGMTLLVGHNGTLIDSTLYPYTVQESSTSAGTYTITFGAALPDGGYGLVAIDAAGNMSAIPTPGDASTFLIDTVAPAAASIAGIDVNSGSTTDRLTNDNTPTLTVTAEAGAILKVGQNGVETTVPYTVQETSAGNYTITFGSALLDGTYGVRVIDKAGNASVLMDGPQSYKFTIDTTAPTAPTVNSLGSTSDTTPTLSGSATLGSNETLTVMVDGTAYTTDNGLVIDAANKVWSLSVSSALTGGDHTISATATDAAGNSAASGPQTFSVVSATTYVNWTQDYSPTIQVVLNPDGSPSGASITTRVHFTKAVTVDVAGGTPTLQLQFVDDSGTHYVVQAAYTGMVGTNALEFSYSLTDPGIVGRYHVDGVQLNGATITGSGETLPANLSFPISTFTADNYIFSSAINSATGGAASEILGPWGQDPTLAPTDGSFSGIDGGGGINGLSVPVYLGAMDRATASGHVLKYDAATHTLTAVAPGGTIVATVTVPSGSNFPTNIHAIGYELMFSDTGNNGAYDYIGAEPFVVFASVMEGTDPIDSTDHNVQGSLEADVINLSGRTATDRYIIKGGAGGDTITGHDGMDYVLGGGGSDLISTGAGDDYIVIENYGGTDTVDGSSGTDRLVAELNGATWKVAGRILGPALEGQGTGADGQPTYRIFTTDDHHVRIADFATGRQLLDAQNVESIQVRLADNETRGSVNFVFDSDGDNLIIGASTDAAGEPRQILSGGAGNDTINAGAASDILMGGGGGDTLNGSAVGNQLYGEDENDVLYGGGGDDWLVGGAGNDTLDGGDGTGDVAGFGLASNDTTTAISYSSDGTTVSIEQGSTVLAQITRGTNGDLLVTDVINATTDTVRNVETLVFDNLNVNGALTLSASTLFADTTAPTLASAVVNGNKLTLTYSEALDAAHQPSSSYFQVVCSSGLTTQSVRTITGMSVNGATVELTLHAPVAYGETVAVSYLAPGTTSTYAIQDAAGNDSISVSNFSVVNSTASTNSEVPYLVHAWFVEGTGTGAGMIKLLFNEVMTLDAAGYAGHLQLLHNGVTPIVVNGVSVNSTGTGTLVTISTSATFASGDGVGVILDGSGYIKDSGGTAFFGTSGAVIAIGGSGDNVGMDLSILNLTLQSQQVIVRTNAGNDSVSGAMGSDRIVGGPGADWIDGSWGADRIYLTEITGAGSDTVVVRDDGSNIVTGYDTVYGFDVTGTTSNDKLDLRSGSIAANTSGNVDGLDSGSLAQHSITGGIVTFKNTAGQIVTINAGNLADAATYLDQNITQAGAVVGFAYDSDNNGQSDSLFVVENSGMIPPQIANSLYHADTMVLLNGVNGVTLGNTAAQNVVQIQDTSGPMFKDTITYVSSPGGDIITLSYQENVSSATGNATGFTITKNGSAVGLTFVGTSGNQVSFQTDTTFADTDVIGLDYANGSNNIRDAAGNFAGGDTVVVGGIGDDTIDMTIATVSNPSGEFYGGAGNDTIYAPDNTASQANENNLCGGSGADMLHGNLGTDVFVFVQGDSTAVTYADTGSVGLNDGDTFSFSAGADLVFTGGGTDMVALIQPSGNRVAIPNFLAATAAPSSGLVADQSYFTVQGDYVSGTFTVNTATGSDTLVVYDGDASAGLAQTALVLNGVASVTSLNNGLLVI